MPMAQPGLLVLSHRLNKLSILFAVSEASVCEKAVLSVQHTNHIVVKKQVFEIRIKIRLSHKVKYFWDNLFKKACFAALPEHAILVS